MYLWNIDGLARQLKHNKVPKKNVQLLYVLSPLLSICNAFFFSVLLLGHHFVSNIFAHFLSSPDQHMDMYDKIGLATGILTTVITFVGMYLCYLTNKKGDGKHFTKRMACLSFPINLQLTLYTLAAFAIISIISYLIIHGKIVLFKEKVLTTLGTKTTIKEALQEAVKDTTGIKTIIKKHPAQQSALGSLLGAPVTLLKLPAIPGHINTFLKTMRGTILSAYPVVAFIPPILSLLHYMLIRRMLRKVASKR